MGERAHIQIKHPEYGNCRLSGNARCRAYEYLNEKGLCVSAGDDGCMSSRWDIDIQDTKLVCDIVAELVNRPDTIVVDGCSHSHQLAAILQEGLNAAMKNNYSVIIIEWW